MKAQREETGRPACPADAELAARDRRSLLLALASVLGGAGLAACGGGGGGGSDTTSTTTTGGTTTGGTTTGGNTTTGGTTTTTTTTTSSEGVTFSTLSGTPQWTVATHSKLATTAIAANIDKVFPGERIQRLDIKIENANWLLMKSNLATLTSQLGGTPNFSSLPDPVTVPCSVYLDGVEWYKVGVRFKGNSSLFSAGSNKLPLKLKFNEFETQYPAITGQRFFGFKTLHLKSNFRDSSVLREHLVDDIFRNWGLASPHSALYQLYLDVGDGAGASYWGVYTVVEDVEDTVIKLQYGNADGNLYKPDDSAGSFAANSFNTTQLALKTNEDGATYADVRALYNAINDSSLYSSNLSAWKAALEAVFDVPRFLKWLAANTVLQNWDTYGAMPHNYYLYANATNGGKLEWIPWDNNEALTSNTRGLALDLSTTTSWPLAYYIGRDSAYQAQYKTYVAQFARQVFNNAALDAVIDARASLVKTAVGNERSGYTYTSASAFTTAVAGLKTHIASRYSAALAYAG